MAYYWADEWTATVAYSTNQVVYGDGFPYTATLFLCIQNHIAAASNEPGVGVDKDLYWDATTLSAYTYAGRWETGHPAAVDTCFDNPDEDGSLYVSILWHITAADKEPGVSPGWETYFSELVEAGSPPLQTDPWYGLGVIGTFFVTEQMDGAVTGTLIVAESEGNLVFRIGAFNEQNLGYDALEDILSDNGVTFV